MFNKFFAREDAEMPIDPDVQQYYVALINEAHSEHERIELGRAAARTMRARRAGRSAGGSRRARRFASLVTG